MQLDATLVKSARPGRKNSFRHRAGVAVLWLLLLLGIGGMLLVFRLAQRPSQWSTAESHLHSIAYAEERYYSEHHHYATSAQLAQMKDPVDFSSRWFSGYRIRVRLIIPDRYDVIGEPDYPFPFRLPAKWAREYGNPVLYMNDTGRVHRFIYGTPIPAGGFGEKFPPEWKG